MSLNDVARHSSTSNRKQEIVTTRRREIVVISVGCHPKPRKYHRYNTVLISETRIL